MKALLRLLLMSIAVTFAIPASATDCDSLHSLRWLLGDWATDDRDTTFHEAWTEIGPRTLEGSGVERAKADGAVKSAEALRLVEMAGRVFYISKVSHNELPVSFRLTGCDDGLFVFENPTHDFPRRLEYRRGADGRLTVRVSDGGEKGFTLDFSRVAATEPKTEVLAAEDARFAAMVAADTAAMRRWFAADLSYGHSTGQVENRDELIASIVSGRMRYVAVEPIERRVSFPGTGVAIMRGRGRFQVVAGETPLDLQIHYLAVYGHENGVWQLRAWQSLRQP